MKQPTNSLIVKNESKCACSGKWESFKCNDENILLFDQNVNIATNKEFLFSQFIIQNSKVCELTQFFLDLMCLSLKKFETSVGFLLHVLKN